MLREFKHGMFLILRDAWIGFMHYIAFQKQVVSPLISKVNCVKLLLVINTMDVRGI